MQVLALLKADRYKRVRAIVGRDDVQSVDLAMLEAQLAQPDPKLVVIDPSRLRPEAFIALVEAARAKRNVAMLVYAALTPDTARVVVEANRIHPIEVVFFGAYNERDALARACEQPMVPSVQTLVLCGLAENLGRLPPKLATSIIGIFGGQPFPPSTNAMLRASGVGSHTARRWLAVAGITQPHQLRSCAVLARTFPELGRSRMRLAQIVAHFGAGSERAFRRTCAALTGLSPRAAGRLPGAEVATRLLAATLAPSDPHRIPRRPSSRRIVPDRRNDAPASPPIVRDVGANHPAASAASARRGDRRRL